MVESMGRTKAKAGEFSVDQAAAAHEKSICVKLTVGWYRVKIQETLMLSH